MHNLLLSVRMENKMETAKLLKPIMVDVFRVVKLQMAKLINKKKSVFLGICVYECVEAY